MAKGFLYDFIMILSYVFSELIYDKESSGNLKRKTENPVLFARLRKLKFYRSNAAAFF